MRGIVLAWLSLLVQPVWAYTFMGSKWPGPEATFHVDIPGASGLWNSTFESAMAAWDAAGFKFYIVRNSYSDPCMYSDYRNGVGFQAHVCGSAFGATTLAVTSVTYMGSETQEADIVFNANESWDVYAGPMDYYTADFRRVAVHELGHALGLGHENRNTAIMAALAGDIETLQPDDIAGVRVLYALSDDYGNTRAAAQDITPNSATSGIVNSGRDVDFFRIRLTSRGRLVLRTTGWTDTVGTLYNSTGSIVATNDDGCNNAQNFCLTRILSAGTYYVKVDGYRTTATGAYRLLSLFRVDDYGNTRLEAKPIAPTSAVNGRINSAADVDFFRIRLTRSGRLSVRTNGTTNTVGTLYGANGAVLATNNNGCRNRGNFCITRNLPLGVYFLEVGGYGTSTGDYSLVSAFR